MPLTPLQRLVARFLPWYDTDAQERKAQRTEALVQEVGRIESVRIGYRAYGERMDGLVDRRRLPR